MLERLNDLKEKIQLQKTQEKELFDSIASKNLQIKNVQSKIYELQETELHLSEILRLAKIHFPRLRNQPEGELTPTDYAEFEKWISRTKSIDSLKAIVLALKELSKYYSQDIKSNLYGLVQKIIIEGPNSQKIQKKT